MKIIKNSAFVGNTGHFDNEIDLAGSEGLEGMKVYNIKKIFSCWLHVLPKELDEKVAKLHFLPLGAELNVPTQNMQFPKVSRLKAPSRRQLIRLA